MRPRPTYHPICYQLVNVTIQCLQSLSDLLSPCAGRTREEHSKRTQKHKVRTCELVRLICFLVPAKPSLQCEPYSNCFLATTNETSDLTISWRDFFCTLPPESNDRRSAGVSIPTPYQRMACRNNWVVSWPGRSTSQDSGVARLNEMHPRYLVVMLL